MAKKKQPRKIPLEGKAKEPRPMPGAQTAAAVAETIPASIRHEPAEADPPAPVAAEASSPQPSSSKPIESKPAQAASSDRLKLFAVALLAVLVILVACYLFVLSGSTFVPGDEVTVEQFKDILISAQKVYIIMDARGVQSNYTRGNIMQCGVDFSSSTFLGGKTVVPFSFMDNECFGASGSRPLGECASELKTGLTIHIREGPPGVMYYSNGMVVMVGPDYKLGGCAIKSG
jgi:hypothetical protein